MNKLLYANYYTKNGKYIEIGCIKYYGNYYLKYGKCKELSIHYIKYKNEIGYI